MGKSLCIHDSRMVTDDEIRSRIRDIYVLSASPITTERNSRHRPAKALRNFIWILRNSSRSQLQLQGTREMIFSIVNIIFRFEEARHKPNGKCDWKRQRDCKIARTCYRDLIRRFIPEKSQDLVHALVEVFHEEKLWRWEDFCWELSRGSMECGIGGVEIIHAFLNLVDCKTNQIQESRAILRVLYRTLDSYSWPNSPETLDAVQRLLQLYYRSLNGAKPSVIPFYAALRKGLEVCVRNVINNLDNEQILSVIHRMCLWSIDYEISDSTILDFGSTLEYAAYIHVSGLYKDTLNAELFVVLMQMLSSSNRLVSLLGNRVFQYLIDRTGNRSQFDTPKIFFEGTSFDIKLRTYNKEDKYFLQRNRQLLHNSLINSAINHCTVRINLESTYCTICLIATEVPCGFTAAALVCLTMHLQDLTLERSEIYREASYHVHATIIAVMSVLCWIHDAKVFYSYVDKIMMERAQWAPHLNPPLKARYSFAVHHVLWNKPELFFVDWEARYGLWKCFRLRESQRRGTEDSAKRARMSA